MNIAFLLGSGTSIPAGYPSVATITEDLLSDQPNHLPSQPGANGGSSPQALAFLRWLETIVIARYASEGQRGANYEDIYFVASQIRDDLRGEFDNPAVRPLVEKAITEHLLPHGDGSLNLSALLETLAADVADDIRGRVVSRLTKPPEQLSERTHHLDFIAQSVRSVGGQNTTVMTLNHDALIETCLDAHGIGFTDGFSRTANNVGVREWAPSSISDGGNVVRLLKLHGGIDWYRFRPDGAEPWSEDYVGIPTADFPTGRVDAAGRRHSTLDRLPIHLIGTFNKLTSYTDPIYLHLYHHAFQAVRRADALVVVGYGFGDKGINKLVTEWICRSPHRRLVVVDRCANTLWRRARGSISGIWRDLLDSKRLITLDRDLQKNDLHWQEIAGALRLGLQP